MTTTQSTTHTLNVPDATLAYDIRPNDTTTEPILLLIGSPMGASQFAGSASEERFQERFGDASCGHPPRGYVDWRPEPGQTWHRPWLCSFPASNARHAPLHATLNNGHTGCETERIVSRAGVSKAFRKRSRGASTIRTREKPAQPN